MFLIIINKVNSFDMIEKNETRDIQGFSQLYPSQLIFLNKSVTDQDRIWCVNYSPVWKLKSTFETVTLGFLHNV